MRRLSLSIVAIVLACLCMPWAHAAASRSSYETWLATSPSPSGLAALPGNAATQRAALMAAGSKLVVVGKRYYSVSIPGGYPEAE